MIVVWYACVYTPTFAPIGIKRCAVGMRYDLGLCKVFAFRDALASVTHA